MAACGHVPSLTVTRSLCGMLTILCIGITMHYVNRGRLQRASFIRPDLRYARLLNEPASSRPAPINCSLLIGDEHITFLNETDINKSMQLRHSSPVYLFSFGGSGNTLTRVLLEYATNIWTGSIYGDRSLLEVGFRGERQCDDVDIYNVLVVKAHPEQIQKASDFQEHPETFLKVCLRPRLQPVYSNMSAIFIVRDPWKAIWSLYQFMCGSGSHNESKHVRHVYLDEWRKQHWLKYIPSRVSQWLATFHLMSLLQSNGYDYIVVEFEKLTNLHDAGIARHEMKRMLQYLYSEQYFQHMQRIFAQRLQCVFPELMKANYQRLGTVHRVKANVTQHVTMQLAYQYVIEHDVSVICKAWSRMRPFAEMYSYENYPGVNCTKEI